MQVHDFDYTLPQRLIATQPPKVRGASRLLVLDRSTGSITHARYADLPNYLHSGDLIVRNDTQVIKARLQGRNKQGSKRELLLLENHGAQDFGNSALYKGKLKAGEQLKVGHHTITVEEVLDGGRVKISSGTPLLDIAKSYGNVPLPPYMHRDATAEDTRRYQTIFAKNSGSVAAPTASLNFTHQLEEQLIKNGTQLCNLTLHVGLGTFLPIRTSTLENHKMHSEYFVVPETTISSISSVKDSGNRVVSIGTTVARTLEYCGDGIAQKTEHTICGEADIFIYPGYTFKVVDALLTNFHAPKSTVLMMAAAFAGWDNLKRAYEEAIKEDYAFLSYGDSMLIL